MNTTLDFSKFSKDPINKFHELAKLKIAQRDTRIRICFPPFELTQVNNTYTHNKQSK
jgi:hypothetical protein